VKDAVFDPTATTSYTGFGFIYDYNKGIGSGKVWGVDANGLGINQ
jgi:hypothetical protein